MEGMMLWMLTDSTDGVFSFVTLFSLQKKEPKKSILKNQSWSWDAKLAEWARYSHLPSLFFQKQCFFYKKMFKSTGQYCGKVVSNELCTDPLCTDQLCNDPLCTDPLCTDQKE